jgi:hypothetical protein
MGTETGPEAEAEAESETGTWTPCPARLAHAVGHSRDSSTSDDECNGSARDRYGDRGETGTEAEAESGTEAEAETGAESGAGAEAEVETWISCPAPPATM